MSRRIPGSLAIAGSLLGAASAACEGAEPSAMHVREGEDPDVLPFIPVCTACLMWTFAGQRWALHRMRPSAAEQQEGPEAAPPIELFAVRLHATLPWLPTADAESYELGEFRVYAWPLGQADEPGAEGGSEDSPDVDAPPGDDKAIRTAQVWITQGEDEGWCVVPWLGGTPLPASKPLAHIVDELDIEVQPCSEVM